MYFFSSIISPGSIRRKFREAYKLSGIQPLPKRESFVHLREGKICGERIYTGFGFTSVTDPRNLIELFNLLQKKVTCDTLFVTEETYAHFLCISVS